MFIFVLLSLVLLVFLHEFFHFIFAKKYKIKVEEFGLGFPPRLYGKKIKETIYSLNLLPLGGFVKIDELELKKSPFKKKFWVIFAGVFSFFLIAYFIFSLNAFLGMPVSSDYLPPKNNEQVRLMILESVNHSPAQKAGLRTGDSILKIKTKTETIEINDILQFQTIVNQNKGKEIEVEILRGKKILSFSLVPRENPPLNEGPLGVLLDMVYIKKSPWYLIFFDGARYTIDYAKKIFAGYLFLFFNLFKEKEGISFVGP
ncbi:MAG: site-2 protease family protein, partial [Minisyncoccales bacterium]